MAFTGDKAYFLEEIAMHDKVKNAANLEAILDAQRIELKKLDVEIDAFVRDNEAKMCLLGESWCNRTGIHDVGCPPHVLHLVFKAIIDHQKFKVLCENANKILLYIKKSDMKQNLMVAAKI